MKLGRPYFYMYGHFACFSCTVLFLFVCFKSRSSYDLKSYLIITSPAFQLIIFMALANGVSRVKSGPITLHTQTAIHFAEQLTKVSPEVQEVLPISCHPVTRQCTVWQAS